MTAKKATILIVEDEVSLSEAYQIVLRKAGYNVVVAFNGEEALREAAKKEPDLILLDLRMPQMDGIEFLKNYNMANHPTVKVIVFSNYDIQNEISEAYKLGAQRYLLKAWASPNELAKLVKDTLAE